MENERKGAEDAKKNRQNIHDGNCFVLLKTPEFFGLSLSVLYPNSLRLRASAPLRLKFIVP